MKVFFESLAQSLEKKQKENPADFSANKTRALAVARVGARLYSGIDNVAWCGVYAPFDLLNAMGVTPCFVEFVGAMLAQTGTAIPALENAEQAGFAAEACGYHRAVCGAAYQGSMPIPDFLVGTSAPCAGGLAVIENLARYFKKDLFVLHMPQETTDAAVEYLASQLKGLTRFVGEHTGRPLDHGILRETIERSNEAAAAMQRVYDLAAHVPSPAAGKDLANFGIVMALFLGREEAIDVAKAYEREFAERIAQGQSGVPGESIRLLWIQNRIQFKQPLIDMIERDSKAAIVCDELNWITWDPIDPDDPFTGIARRMIGAPLSGPAEQRLAHIRRMAETYRVHGAINPCNWGCRQGAGARGMIQEDLGKIGVPVLNLEVDCVDRRNFAEGQMRTRLEAFLEMLDSRPSPWPV